MQKGMKIMSIVADLIEEMLQNNPEGTTVEDIKFSDRAKQIVAYLSNEGKQSKMYKMVEHQREAFERDSKNDSPQLMYAYMIDRVAKAPTDIHAVASAILISPILERKLRKEEDDGKEEILPGCIDIPENKEP